MRKTNVEKLADWFMENTDVQKMNRSEIEDFLLELGCDGWIEIIDKLNIKSIKPQSVIDMTPKFADIINKVINKIEYKQWFTFK
jgi:hypothetical protein